jgi:hypothetical protein
MRKYSDFQEDATLLSGEQAELLKQTATRFDDDAERICQELHAALNAAQQKFKTLAEEYRPQFERVLAGTPLEGTNIDNVGFDMRHLDKHGIAFARARTKNPLEAFLEAIGQTVSDGPGAFEEDRIIVEPIRGRQRERENA